MNRVPNELWLETFQYLPKDILKHVSMTSRTFYRISRHLLFDKFLFHPYTVDISGAVLLPEAQKLEHSLDRLNFWCSEDVAPLVRSCIINPWRHGDSGTGYATWKFSETDSPYILLARFFELLPRFTGMQRLHAFRVHFTQSGVANVCCLPSLDCLRINMCEVAPGQCIDPSSLSLRVSNFYARQYTSSRAKIDHWIRLLDPNQLRELDVMGYPFTYVEGICAVPSFPRVRTLMLTMDPSTPSQNLAILSRFPAVEVFTRRFRTDPSDVDDPRVEPVAITGPPMPSLRRLRIYGCDPDDVMIHLDTLRIPSTVTSLEIFFHDFDLPTLAALCGFFPQLTELWVSVHVWLDEEDVSVLQDGVNTQAASFFRALANDPPLPPTLRHLALSWQFSYDIADDVVDPTSGGDPPLTALRDVVVARCPALTTLWLNGGDYVLQWWKWRDGTVEEYTAQTRADAKIFHADFRGFWDSRNAPEEELVR
ncbi:hypothetical protein C8R43DRAFT_1193010 [Mycena crocata]|nr:hypothetical protein C8R43DRAFT_1193010 [Mycena crocata]